LADSPALGEQSVAAHALRHHFADMEQQRESSTLGMWVFLVTEIMFFGGLFAAYLVYRTAHFSAWEVGSQHMDFWLGTINTTILLCSSLFVALSVRAAQLGRRKQIVLFLAITVLLGLAFLGVKGLEYYRHFEEGAVPGSLWHLQVPNAGQVQLFFLLYFTMTGLHALHVTIGVFVLAAIAWFAWKGHYTPEYHTPVHVAGLYWHFVDIVWIFLYPLLYLIAHRHA
jgi:cytochrome c oxidase subunit 3